MDEEFHGIGKVLSSVAPHFFRHIAGFTASALWFQEDHFARVKSIEKFLNIPLCLAFMCTRLRPAIEIQYTDLPWNLRAFF
jgi:hypothetical protein